MATSHEHAFGAGKRYPHVCWHWTLEEAENGYVHGMNQQTNVLPLDDSRETPNVNDGKNVKPRRLQSEIRKLQKQSKIPNHHKINLALPQKSKRKRNMKYDLRSLQQSIAINGVIKMSSSSDIDWKAFGVQNYVNELKGYKCMHSVDASVSWRPPHANTWIRFIRRRRFWCVPFRYIFWSGYWDGIGVIIVTVPPIECAFQSPMNLSRS